MPRYIDADVVIEHAEILRAYESEREALQDTIEWLKAYGSADVVEVVRCKECVHHKNAPKTTDVWCERLDGLLPEDWFCADGERRDDGSET